MMNSSAATANSNGVCRIFASVRWNGHRVSKQSRAQTFVIGFGKARLHHIRVILSWRPIEPALELEQSLILNLIRHNRGKGGST